MRLQSCDLLNHESAHIPHAQTPDPGPRGASMTSETLRLTSLRAACDNNLAIDEVLI